MKHTLGLFFAFVHRIREDENVSLLKNTNMRYGDAFLERPYRQTYKISGERFSHITCTDLNIVDA